MRIFPVVSILALSLAITAGCGSLRPVREPPLPSALKAELVREPAMPAAGIPQKLVFKVTDARGLPAGDLRLNHERYAHFIVCAENLQDFQHLHAEDFGPVTDEMFRSATFPVTVTFRWGGNYTVGVDFQSGDEPLHRTFTFPVSGPGQPPPDYDFTTAREVDGMIAHLLLTPDPPLAGKPAEGVVLLTEGGRPVMDLEPWLGALSHLAIFSEKARDVAHVHGGGHGPAHGEAGGHMHEMDHDDGHTGPDIHFGHTFGDPGRYRIYAQFQRKGNVHTTHFDVRAAEPLVLP